MFNESSTIEAYLRDLLSGGGESSRHFPHPARLGLGISSRWSVKVPGTFGSTRSGGRTSPRHFSAPSEAGLGHFVPLVRESAGDFRVNAERR
jgi:hypothetical protein